MRKTVIPFLTLALAAIAHADGGTLQCTDEASCVAAAVEWDGAFEATITAGLPEQCLAGETGWTCDRFQVTVDLPDGYWAAHPGRVEFAIRWVTESTDRDLDLYVYRGGAPVAKSAGQDSDAEVAFVEDAPDGLYDVYVVPVSMPVAIAYEGRIEVEARPAVEPVRDLLPNMTTLPPDKVKIATGAYYYDPIENRVVSCYPEEILENDPTPTRCLRFDQIAHNTGSGPLELRYTLDEPLAPDLRQRIYKSDGTHRDVVAETMELHPIHGHWHYKGFGLGRLYDTSGAKVRESKKQGFCLVEVDFESWGQKGNDPRTHSFPGCQTPNEGSEVVQGIGVGWADVYNWFLADQFIDITGLADGVYRLEIVADPDDTLVESDEGDNANSIWVLICGNEATKASGPDAACPAVY